MYVGNLLASATSADLRKLFGAYGTVTNAQVVVDQVHRTGRSLGFGYVEMADGAEAAISALNGAKFMGNALTVNEAQRSPAAPSKDRFSEIIDRYDAYQTRPESQEFREVLHDLRELAEAGHLEAAQYLAELFAFPGPHYDPASAYKWYYIALSQEGYTVEFEDQNHTPPYYGGPVGDFRNESIPSNLVVMLGFDKVRALDAEAKQWLAERNLTSR